MDFDFSAEQKLFKDQVRKALGASCPLKEVRRVLEGGLPYSEPAWATLREMQVPGIAIPEQYGGLGLGYYELCVAAEEAGRALAPVPLGSTFLAAEAVLAAGSESQKREWLPRLASGEVVGSFCDFQLDKGRLEFKGGTIEGRCGPAGDAAAAELAVVLAQHAQGPTLALVRLNQVGVSRRVLDSIDPSRNVCELRFEGTKAEILGGAGAGRELVQRLKRRAAVPVAFEQIGGADRALEMAREYALQRKAFGRPIGSYQAIKHKLANIYIKNEIARAHAYYAAWALSTDSADLPTAASAARVAATEAFSFAAQENIQTHGGMGATWEADCHLFYRRARLLALQLGSVLEWKDQLAVELDQAAAAN